MEIDSFIAEAGVSLEPAGVTNYAFTKSKAMEFLGLLRTKKVAVLGGDVYLPGNNCMRLTYDNWHTNKQSDEGDDSYIQRSIIVSMNFVEKYQDTSAHFAFTLRDMDIESQ